MQNLHTAQGRFKADHGAAPAFPLDGFHRKAAALVIDSGGFDHLTEWEQAFITNIAANAYPTLNEKQWAVLSRLIAFASRIERRALGVKS